MLNNLDALKAAHAKALELATEENRIAMALPVTPKRVLFTEKSTPWVAYEAKSLAEALDIFKYYTPAPFVIAKDGSFTLLCTRAEMDAKNVGKRVPYTARFESEGAPYFDCSAGEKHALTDMEFFTNAAGRDLKIIVHIRNCPIGVQLSYIERGARFGGPKYRKDYPTVPHADTLHWGYGEDTCKCTYWFRDIESFWLSMETYTDI